VVQNFYSTMAQVSFTLLGLWWIVVQFKYTDFMRDRRRRIQAYDTSLYFVLPGIMSLVSLIASTGLLWRVTFTTAAVLGAVEAGFLLATTRRAQASRLSRWARYAGMVLYVLVALFAVVPPLTKHLGLHVAALQVEGVFLALIVFLGFSPRGSSSPRGNTRPQGAGNSCSDGPSSLAIRSPELTRRGCAERQVLRGGQP